MGKKSKRLRREIIQSGASPVISPKVGATGLRSMTNWLAVLVLVLPVIISGKALDPALTPRYIFLIIFSLLFVLFFYLLQKKILSVPSIPVKIIFGLGIAYGLWSLLSMMNSVNYREGYMDTARHFLQLIVLYILVNTVMQEEGQLMKICKAVMLVSLLQSIIGIGQYYDIAFTEVPGANEKPFGLMANRNFFGSAQVFVLPFVIYVLYKGSKAWKYAAGLALAGLIISITLSQTRSAWLATIAVLLVSTILVLVFSSVNRKKWLMSSLIVLVGAAAIVSLLIFSDSESGLSQSVKERAVSITGNFSSATNAGENISERLKIWNKTVHIIKDHPVMGVGPGNWKIVMPSYGTEGMIFANGVFSPDRPHNVYLQVTAETGLVGALFYFGAWLMIAVCGFRVIKKSTSENRRILVILMLSGLAAFATDSMFSFPVDRIEHCMYMLLMGGIVMGCYARQSADDTIKSQPLKKVFILPVLAIILFNLLVAIKAYNFGKHWKLAMAYNKKGQHRETIEEAGKGKNSFICMDVSGNPIEIFSTGAYKGMKDYTSALKEIKTAAEYHPYNSKIYNEWGTLYTDLNKFDSAIIYFEKALRLTPNAEVVLKNLSVNYFNVGNYAACIAALGKVKTEGDEFLTNLLNEAKRRMAQPK